MSRRRLPIDLVDAHGVLYARGLEYPLTDQEAANFAKLNLSYSPPVLITEVIGGPMSSRPKKKSRDAYVPANRAATAKAGPSKRDKVKRKQTQRKGK